jgi:tetratricopeptide (TPR) repeat protein
MMRLAKGFLIAVLLGAVAFAQAASPQSPNSAPADNRASAYYNFAMGRVYAELAQADGNKDDIDKAIQHYREALKADPKAGIILDELTDLYLAINRLDDATALAQDLLKQNPDDVDAHRMLGRIYTAALAHAPQGKIDERALRMATQEYEKVTAKDPKDVESWVMLAKLYGTAGNAADAEKAYNSALAVEPDNEDALTGLAMLYGNMGDTKRAIEKLKAATDKNPNDHSLRVLAQAYEEQKDYKSAADVLRKAMALSPDDDRLLRGLAEDLYFSDQTGEALKIYQDLSARSPHDPLIPLRMAEIYTNNKDYARAHEAIDNAKKIDPDGLEPRQAEIKLFEVEGKYDQAIAAMNTLLADTARKVYSKEEQQERAGEYKDLGELNQRAGHYPEAIDAFKKMGTVYTDSLQVMEVELIDTYIMAKDLPSAQKESDAALKKFPNEYLISLAHAEVLGDMGKTDDAATELRGLMNGPRDFQTLMTAAGVYEKGKRWDDMAKALDDAEKLATSDDDKERVFFDRGAMFERMKKYAESESAFRQVLALNPQHSEALNYLGYTLADRNVRLDEAYQLIKKAVDLEPDNGAFLDSLGWVYYRQGKLTDAESCLIKASSHMDADPTVHDHLGDVYSKLGKTKDAIAQWTASLKGFKDELPSEVDPEEVSKVGTKLDAARVKLAQETKRQ